ncbi:hypothetical protein ABIB57_003492 [Devosia sp. UYZn731]
MTNVKAAFRFQIQACQTASPKMGGRLSPLAPRPYWKAGLSRGAAGRAGTGRERPIHIAFQRHRSRRILCEPWGVRFPPVGSTELRNTCHPGDCGKSRTIPPKICRDIARNGAQAYRATWLPAGLGAGATPGARSRGMLRTATMGDGHLAFYKMKQADDQPACKKPIGSRRSAIRRELAGTDQ